MIPNGLNMGEAGSGRRRTPRRAALEALDRLLRAHAVLSEHRRTESPYGLLRPAQEDEIELIEAVFIHCGVPLPDTLRAIYRRTLGVGNPVAALPVLSVPFLRAALPPEDRELGPVVAGLEVFERELGLFRDETALERPPFLPLGHAEVAGLTVSRNGLWSIKDYRRCHMLPPSADFGFVFETAFCAYVDQVLVLWANDLAGAVLKPESLILKRDLRPEELPASVRSKMAQLVTSRPADTKSQGEVQALDHPDLLRTTQRGNEGHAPRFQELIAVVGLPYGDYTRVSGQIGTGTRLRMHPVDDNPHDSNAVEVWFDDDPPVRVGFVERRAAARIRALPQGVPKWRLKVMGASGHSLHVALELARSERDCSRKPEDPAEKASSGGRPDLFSGMDVTQP